MNNHFLETSAIRRFTTRKRAFPAVFTLFVLLSLSVLLPVVTSVETASTETQIIYLGNEGFLVNIDGKKVVFDGLHTFFNKNYVSPSEKH